jgi:hypothetical protein
LAGTLSSVRLNTPSGSRTRRRRTRHELSVAQPPIRLPRQNRFIKPAAAQLAAELAYLGDVGTKLLLARHRPPERALPVG